MVHEQNSAIMRLSTHGWCLPFGESAVYSVQLELVVNILLLELNVRRTIDVCRHCGVGRIQTKSDGKIFKMGLGFEWYHRMAIQYSTGVSYKQNGVWYAVWDV
jgi:hypothetical protein